MEKYTLDEGNESLQRVKLLMSYKNSLTLNENLHEQGLTDAAKNIALNTATFGMYGLTKLLFAENGNNKMKFKNILNGCKTMQLPEINEDKFDAFADTINSAIDGIGTGTDEIKKVFGSLTKIQYICALDKAYKIHGDLFTDLVEDLETDEQWKDTVILPLRTVIRNNEKTKSEETKPWVECVKTLKDGKDSEGIAVKIDTEGNFYYKNGIVKNPKTNNTGKYEC